MRNTHSNCNSLQDVEEITIVSSDNPIGTESSWSKYYSGYNKKHPVHLNNGTLLFNYHVTLIFRNNKYSIIIESSIYDAGKKISIVEMYYSL